MDTDISNGTRSKSFGGTRGGAEHFISVEAQGELDLAAQIAQIEERYATARAALDLPDETAIFRRIFISDAMNQAAVIRDSALIRATPHSPVAVSLVQQAPLPGAKIALLAYHLADDATLSKRRLSKHDLLVEKNGQRHLWTTGLCAGENSADTSPPVQTRAVFDELIGTLAGEGGTLRENCVRTWIYLKDVDVFYQGMVESRGAIFAEQGLTGDTHFIASTGIEGACAHRYDLVAMDAYSNLDLDQRQVSYLNDFARLCATKDYNVHFERGTRIAYADRAHHFISGTASIDKDGQVVHPGDVLRQFDHAVANVEALPRSSAASLADLMHLIVYLRDPTDFARIKDRLAERFPGLPRIIVQGAVCRPQWLVEVEGMAIAANDAPTLPSF
ncbi:MAG: Rid family hydrolase [Hyphomicrobiales bacterium]